MDKVQSWTYGSYTITYDERADEFVVNEGEELGLAKRPTLTAAKTYCDGRDKRLDAPAKKKKLDIEVWYSKYTGSLTDVIPSPFIITSVTEQGGCWIKNIVTNEREKISSWSVSGLKVRDAASLDIVRQAKELTDKINALKEQKSALLSKLVSVKLPTEVA